MPKTPQVGEPAPDFELPGTDGPFKLSDHLGERVVLLFYPGDETMVCKKRFCSYCDRADDSAALGASSDIARLLLGEVVRCVCRRDGASAAAPSERSSEASRLARELPGMGAADLQALGRFEVAARIGTGGGSSVRIVTGRTRAPDQLPLVFPGAGDDNEAQDPPKANRRAHESPAGDAAIERRATSTQRLAISYGLAVHQFHQARELD
jgi:hypothetical protein